MSDWRDSGEEKENLSSIVFLCMKEESIYA